VRSDGGPSQRSLPGSCHGSHRRGEPHRLSDLGSNFETRLSLVFTWLPPDDRESLVQHLLLDNARTSAVDGQVHLRTFEKRLEDLERSFP